MKFKSKIKCSIAYKLIFYILLFSTLITVIITLTQLFIDYKNDINAIYRAIGEIEKTHLKSLTSSVWFLNRDVVKIQLDGILNIRDIEYVEIYEGERYFISSGNVKRGNIISRKFPLIYHFENHDKEIGTLTVVATLDGVYSRLCNKIFIILISQGAKTFLVSIFIFFIFQFLVTRHLSAVALYLKELNPDSIYESFRLRRRKVSDTEKDELDHVVTAVNDMLCNIKNSYSALNNELKLREKAETELQKAHDALEHRVKERTTELARTNEALQIEIYEREKAEEIIRISEEKYRTLFENAQAGIFRIALWSGEILDANQRFAEIFGYRKREEIQGLFITEFYTDITDGKKIVDILRKEENIIQLRLKMRRKDSSDIWVESSSHLDSDDETVEGILIDITERKKAEERIAEALREKEILLREIHHRVKNNMQVIVSLTRLHGKTINDSKMSEIFKEIQNRITAMSLIHETLYRSESLSQISLKNYVPMLANNLSRVYRGNGGIEIKIDVGEVWLGIDHAVPFGLVINELLSNSFKYAFENRSRGEIRIYARSSSDNEIEMVISDNGKGIPNDVDFRQTDTLGLKLVTGLVEVQLNGHIELKNNNGTEFTIKFKTELSQKRMENIKSL